MPTRTAVFNRTAVTLSQGCCPALAAYPSIFITHATRPPPLSPQGLISSEKPGRVRGLQWTVNAISAIYYDKVWHAACQRRDLWARWHSWLGTRTLPRVQLPAYGPSRPTHAFIHDPDPLLSMIVTAAAIDLPNMMRQR